MSRADPNNARRVDCLVRLPLQLLIVRPHPNDLYGFDVVQNLIDKAVLNVDSP